MNGGRRCDGGDRRNEEHQDQEHGSAEGDMLDHQLPRDCQRLRDRRDLDQGSKDWMMEVTKGLEEQMRTDGRVNHDFEGPTMACDDAGIVQDPYDEAWDDVSGKKLDPGM
eukprot:14168000-Alexandrium_andersonii.AAC.1